jgi:hypothetical protein
MLARSFPLLCSLTLVGCILAGCGGSAAPKAQWQTVRGPSFRFEAPKDWRVGGDRRRTFASHDSELVQVATFALVHAYRPALFTRIEPELSSRMAGVARQTKGRVIGHSVVTVAGIRSHSYDVRVGDHVDEYTFVLRAKREYQLLCRRQESSDSKICSRLVSSLSLV